jgi:hypothetical protein
MPHMVRHGPAPRHAAPEAAPRAGAARGARADARATMAPVDVRTFEAPGGERLDVAIAQALALSRTYAKELIDEGYVTIDGRPVGKPATKLEGHELVSVLLPPPAP